MGTVHLIYIGGFGRSGSTLLEALLASSPDVVACGEVVEALSKWDRNRRCSCGKTAGSCPIWGALPGEDPGTNGWSHKDLDTALMQITGRFASIMTDSSKTAWASVLAPFSLHNAFGRGFSLVHLVRDPRAVCWSVINREMKRAERDGRSPRVLRRTMRSAFGWLIANLACELFGLLHQDRYVRVRYEILAQEPKETVAKIFRTLMKQNQVQIKEDKQTGNRHQLFGNRARLVPLSFEDVRPDDTWTRNLPASSQRVTEFLCGWLHCRYARDTKAADAKVTP